MTSLTWNSETPEFSVHWVPSTDDNGFKSNVTVSRWPSVVRGGPSAWPSVDSLGVDSPLLLEEKAWNNSHGQFLERTLRFIEPKSAMVLEQRQRMQQTENACIILTYTYSSRKGPNLSVWKQECENNLVPSSH